MLVKKELSLILNVTNAKSDRIESEKSENEYKYFTDMYIFSLKISGI